MTDAYGLDSNNLPRVFNPPPGWNEVLVSWQAKNVGWQPPTADWVPPGVAGAHPAPAGWQFWVPNPILLATAKKALMRRALLTIGIGAGMLLAGVIATIVAQNMASGGQSFIIFTGLMLVGLFRIVLGIVRLIRVPFAAQKSLSPAW